MFVAHQDTSEREIADPAIKHRDTLGRRLGEKTYMFQYHADQDPEYLVRFWSSGLGVDPGLIRPQRKSTAWIDRQQDGWLDSLFSGV